MSIKKLFITSILIFPLISFSNDNIVPFGYVGEKTGEIIGGYVGGTIGTAIGGEAGKHIGGFIGSEIGGYIVDKIEDYNKDLPSKPIDPCYNPYPYTAECVNERID